MNSCKSQDLSFHYTLFDWKCQVYYDIIVLENELSSVLAAKLTIKWNGHAGDIQIKCDNLDKLDAILQRLSIGGPLE